MDVDRLLQLYLELVAVESDSPNLIGTAVPIPKIKESDLIELSRLCRAIISKRPVVEFLNGPYYVVGDLHGNLVDLCRILHQIGDLNEAKICFLGDYVDRGEFSCETIALLMCLLITYPQNICLLRGNHEFKFVNSKYGFKEEVISLYSSERAWDEINEMFNYLPLAAVINNTYFCVHGGLAPGFNQVSQINKLERPITDFTEPLVYGILWSDPNPQIRGFSDSLRGNIFNFGLDVMYQFLQMNRMKMIFRAHQCVMSGLERTGNVLMTIFSTSCYSSQLDNGAGFIRVPSPKETELHEFFLDPFRPPKRDQVCYTKVAPTVLASTHTMQAFGQGKHVLLAIPTITHGAQINRRKSMPYVRSITTPAAKKPKPLIIPIIETNSNSIISDPKFLNTI